MAKHQFQTEVNQLLHLMIHSLYSNKEIFLRELVSNASDALDKLNYLTLTDEKFKGMAFDPRIEISFDDNAKTLTIKDSGIGMNEADSILQRIDNNSHINTSLRVTQQLVRRESCRRVDAPTATL